MILRHLTVGLLRSNCYILVCQATHEAVVIDPGDFGDAILAVLQEESATLRYILATHGHFDHVMAARPLQEATGAPFMLHKFDEPFLSRARASMQRWTMQDPGPAARIDRYLPGEGEIAFGREKLEIRFTPGHSPGSVTFVHHAGRQLFSGDLIFRGAVGRTDFPGGDYDTLVRSIQQQIFTLPDDYRIWPGHKGSTTVGYEKRHNPMVSPAISDLR